MNCACNVAGQRRHLKSKPNSANGGLARISPLLRNFVPLPYLPRPRIILFEINDARR